MERNPQRSPEERLQAVLEASRLKDEELGAFLRKKALHEAILTEWKASALEALGSQKKSSDARRVRELEKQLLSDNYIVQIQLETVTRPVLSLEGLLLTKEDIRDKDKADRAAPLRAIETRRG